MLPIRLREALIGGLLQSIAHICIGITDSKQTDWPQVKYTTCKRNFICNN